jgi:hypothetical protein
MKEFSISLIRYIRKVGKLSRTGRTDVTKSGNRLEARGDRQ